MTRPLDTIIKSIFHVQLNRTLFSFYLLLFFLYSNCWQIKMFAKRSVFNFNVLSAKKNYRNVKLFKAERQRLIYKKIKEKLFVKKRLVEI